MENVENEEIKQAKADVKFPGMLILSICFHVLILGFMISFNHNLIDFKSMGLQLTTDLKIVAVLFLIATLLWWRIEYNFYRGLIEMKKLNNQLKDKMDCFDTFCYKN